jgi:hypothetical protein
MRRFTRLIVLTTAALVAAAAPAGAAPLLANEKYKWFYWAAPILAVLFFLMVVGLCAMYVRKVVLPRYRGRRVE